MMQSPSETMHFSSFFASGTNTIGQHPTPVKATKKMSLSDYTATRVKRTDTADSPVAESHDSKPVASDLHPQSQGNISPELSAQALQIYAPHRESPGNQQSEFNFTSNLVTPRPVFRGSNVQNPVTRSSPDTDIQQPGFNFSSNLVKPQPTAGTTNVQSSNLTSSSNTNNQQPGFNFVSNVVTPEEAVERADVQNQSPSSLPNTNVEQSGIVLSSNLILPEPVCVKNEAQMPDLVPPAVHMQPVQEGLWDRRW